MRRHIVAVLLLLFIVVVSGSAQEESEVIGPETYPDNINPLTGLPVEDAEVLNRRPLIVKISNFPPIVRPQSGLNQADMVWEHLLSGGVTRFSAIFLSEDFEKIGPIRSARLVDMELIRIYRAMFSYSGMAQGTIDVMNRDSLVLSRAVGSGPCPAQCRYPEEGLALEHTLYGDTAALRDLAEERERDTEPEPVFGMAFRETPPEGGVEATRLTVNYRETDSGWEWDEASGKWFRSQDDEPHFDAATDSRVQADNVLILEDQHVIQPFVRDQYWGPPNFAFYVNFIGSGRVFLFRDGRYYEGIWRRDTQDGVLTYYDLEGNALPFKPGKTFVSLVPEWVDGYQLTIVPADPIEVTISGADGVGVNLRLGPGQAYISPDVAYPGDTFSAIGRNRSADWVQVLGFGGSMFWVPVETLDLDPQLVESLPVTRPIVER